MDRQQAFEELQGRLKTPSLLKHSIAVEAIMRELAEHFGEDVDKWGLAGLMHDIDVDKVAGDMTKHGLVGADILEDLGFDSSIVYSVKAHNDYHNLERKRKMDKALFAADPVSGLIVAASLITPSKNIVDVTLESLIKRFNEKDFAKGASRERIKECIELGFELNDFLKLSLDAMKKIQQ